MDRRQFITILGAGTLPFSGCISAGRYTSKENTTATTTNTSTYELTDHSFRVLTTDPSLERDHAEVSFPDRAVQVTGVIQTTRPCHSAQLNDYGLDPNNAMAALDVAITTYKPSDAENCTNTTVGVEYEARFEFADLTPGHVFVTHDGEQANDGPEID